MEFCLYRIQIIARNQNRLTFNQDENFTSNGKLDRRKILITLIEEAKTRISQGRTRWSIGNFRKVDENGYLFKFGRLSKSHKGKYEGGNFVETNDDDAIATDIFIDIHLQVIAIAKRTQVARMQTICNALKTHLGASELLYDNNLFLEIAPIKDPESLAKSIREAFRVGDVKVTIRHPNAFDSNEDFIQPLQEAVAATNADYMDASLKGNNLNKKITEDIARNTAARGGSMSAKIQTEPSALPVTKSLDSDQAVVAIPQSENVGTQSSEPFFKFSITDTIQRIRDFYHSIRGTQQL